jgi:hypothetical protein
MMARKVRIMRPEQMSSTRASATWTTTRILRARWRSRLWLGAATFPQAGSGFDAGVFDDRDNADEEAGKQSQAEREEKHGNVDADLVDTGQAGGRDGYQGAQRSECERKADGAAGQAEDEAFNEQFAGSALPWRAEGGPDGELLTAAFYANEQQVGHVGACDE